MTKVLLEARNVSKAFPGVQALDDVSIVVNAGEVLAIVGHNGSGKSTLVKILAGVYQADQGLIIPSGRTTHGVAEGLHFIHQDLGLVPTLSAIENIDVARSTGLRSVRPIRPRKERDHALALIGQFGIQFDVTAPVALLSPAERTIAAIARALDGWTTADNVLVLDEPTAALQGEEVRKLFAAVQALRQAGAGIILISHRLDEVVDQADRVCVLRDGKVVAEHDKGSYDKSTLVRLIAGETGEDRSTRSSARSAGDVRLRVRGLATAQVRSLDLDARAGEVLGVTGLLGSGMEQVAGAIFGAVPAAGGQVTLDGRTISPNSPPAAAKAGIGFAPSDRRRLGAVVTMNARENLTLPLLSPLRRLIGDIDGKAEMAEATKWMDSVGVRPSRSANRLFSLFSGGNQQKIVIAKWLRTRPSLMLLEEPTQGVDVGAQSSIHELVLRMADDGAAVLVVSTDTKELIALCDRVLVMHDGVVTAELAGDGLTEQSLIRATIDSPGHPTSQESR